MSYDPISGDRFVDFSIQYFWPDKYALPIDVWRISQKRCDYCGIPLAESNTTLGHPCNTSKGVKVICDDCYNFYKKENVREVGKY